MRLAHRSYESVCNAKKPDENSSLRQLFGAPASAKNKSAAESVQMRALLLGELAKATQVPLDQRGIVAVASDYSRPVGQLLLVGVFAQQLHF